MWLEVLPEQYRDKLPELKQESVQDLLDAAGRLAKGKLDEAGSLQALTVISEHLAQISTKLGYPLSRRVVVGAILQQRISSGRPYSPALQQMVDQVLRQLFQVHKQSAAYKGLVQFFHISKSGGTNMCMCAASNGCTTEGFDVRLTCMIRSE